MSFSELLPAEAAPGLLADVLAVGLAPVALLRPVPDAAGVPTDFAFAYLNPAGQKLLQLGFAQLPATVAQLRPADGAATELAFCRQAWATGEARQVFRYRAEGAERRLQATARRCGNQLAVSFSFGQDLTELAQAEQASEARESAAYDEAIRQREQLYRVLEQAPAMICVFDGPQHVFQFVNPPYQALVGSRPLVGLPIAEAMPELAGQPIFGLLDQVYSTGETYLAHEMLVQLDHHNQAPAELDKRYYNFIYQARRNAAGIPDGIFVFANEVTPQVLARQQLEQLNQELEVRVAARTRETEQARAEAEQQRNRLIDLFTQAPSAICVLAGPSLAYEFVNATYQQAFPGRPLLGLPVLDALPELRHTPLADVLTRVYTTGEPYVASELPLQLARYHAGPLEDQYWTFTYQPRRGVQGEVDGILVFGHDVTAQVQARQSIEASQHRTQALADELHQANTQLTRTNADLDNFIYTASHDLRAPISNLEGLFEALKQELELPAAEANLGTVLHLMQDSIRRFQRTISALTDLTRLQKSHEQPVQTVVLADLLESVRLDLAPQLAATGGQLTTAVGTCHTVQFAEKNLRSIVYNLLSNALKYHAPNRPPQVRVSCHDTPGATVLEVQDNGLGLSAAQQGKLFGMFQRLHDHVEGSGIGLYMVKKIMENAGGRIEVDSQLGAGSTFRVFLPTAAATAPAAA